MTAHARTNPARREHRSHRRGFTLLEVVLAIALLASMSVLIGALLSQTREWSEDSGNAGASLRVTRVIEALREQWGSRRTAVGITENGASVSVSPEAILFVTARPLLFTDWPLAIAEYRIEEDFTSSAGQGRRWKLIYTERRVTAMKDETSDKTDFAGRALVESITLLSNCEALEWQRPPKAAAAEAGAEGTAESEGAEQASSSARPAEPRPGEPEHFRRIEWAAVTPESTKEPGMVRLSGQRNKEAFSCVLIVRASR
jgi:prepilin-type N-terminal cleavage/methylation domain-containing protein